MKNVIYDMRRSSLLPVTMLVKQVNEQARLKKNVDANDFKLIDKVGLMKAPEIDHQTVSAIGSTNIVTYSAIKNVMIDYNLLIGQATSYLANLPTQEIVKDLNAFETKISKQKGWQVLAQKVWVLGKRNDFHFQRVDGAGILMYQLNYEGKRKFFAIISSWGNVNKASWIARFWRKMTYKELHYDRRRWV